MLVNLIKTTKLLENNDTFILSELNKYVKLFTFNKTKICLHSTNVTKSTNL